MKPFDPDEYLKENGDAFDPDAYLAESAKPKNAKEDSSATMAGLESFANAATLGYLPHITAAVEQLMPDPAEGLDEALGAKNLTIKQPTRSYGKSRDENIKHLEEQREKHPIASGVGTVSGIVGTGALTGIAGLGIKGATTGARALSAAKTGALIGAVANPGDIEGEINPLQLDARAKNAAIGGVLGAGVQGAGEKIASNSKRVADYIRNKANERAYKALQPIKSVAEKDLATGKNIEIGKQLLDDDAIPLLGTPSRIEKRVDQLKQVEGEEIGRILDKADGTTVQYTPVKFKNPKKGEVVTEEVRATPVRFDENPAKRAFPWLRDKDAPPVLIKGEEQAVQKAMLTPPGPYGMTTGQVKTVPGQGMSVDMKKISKNLLSSDEFKSLETQYGTGAARNALTEYLEKLGAEGSINLRAAQKLRQNVDKGIKFSKRSQDLSPAQEILLDTRTSIRDAMNDVANNLKGESKDALLKANRRYGNLESTSDILDKSVAKDASNRSISLTDTISSAGGMATGNPLFGLGLGALNKGVRTFGDSVGARTLKKTSEYAQIPDKLQKLAAENPVAARIIAKMYAGGQSGAASDIRRPDLQRESQSPVLQDQRLMELFREDPKLVDSIDDEHLKAKIRREVARSTSSKGQGVN